MEAVKKFDETREKEGSILEQDFDRRIHRILILLEEV